jgi:hypothetical protein
MSKLEDNKNTILLILQRMTHEEAAEIIAKELTSISDNRRSEMDKLCKALHSAIWCAIRYRDDPLDEVPKVAECRLESAKQVLAKARKKLDEGE